ncbi:MFS transporter [uncultured Albimonas sp.]|uniref:MFS transporter n=1 Tax=uncultured Albimonas sp. TaxID=1331701 RepID=UPI0030EB99FA|tara:strand:+ start:9221 stop:10423 length:1203 start_codon:yes stop_codon:yes gene_type:complete
MDIVALMVIYILSQFYRTFLAVLAPALTADLGVTAAELSHAAGSWYLFFSLAQLPTGVLLDRFGPRRVVAAFLCGPAFAGALVFSQAHDAFELTLGVALIGIGCAPILMSGMFLFARRYPPARFATLSGLMIGVGGLGNILGAAPFAFAVEAFGWREMMLFLAATGLMCGAVAFLVLRDPPPLPVEPGAKDAGFRGFLELLRMPLLLAMLPLALTNYAVAGGIRGLWAGPYLADIHGFDAAAIGMATLCIAVAMMSGNFVYAPLDRVFGSRKPLILSANVAGFLCVAWLAFGAPGAWTAVALMTACGFFGATYAVLIAHWRSFVPLRLTGRGVTLINVTGMMGTALGQFATGALADAPLSAGEFATGYERVFLWYAATLLIGLTIYALFARDARPDHVTA